MLIELPITGDCVKPSAVQAVVIVEGTVRVSISDLRWIDIPCDVGTAAAIREGIVDHINTELYEAQKNRRG